MTTFAELNTEIRGIEGELAYGSETMIYGDFASRMIDLGGKDWRESDAEVPSDEVAWWRKAYQLYREDLAKPEGERFESIQDLFDSIDA